MPAAVVAVVKHLEVLEVLAAAALELQQTVAQAAKEQMDWALEAAVVVAPDRVLRAGLVDLVL
jgi:hypothetical protein